MTEARSSLSNEFFTSEGEIKPAVWRRSSVGKYLRLIPRKKQLKDSFLHRKLGDKFLREEYWQPTRKAISRGFAIGCFWAMIPMPFQMIPSGLFSILLRANIPLSLAAVWITNPITHPILIVFQLWLGECILNQPSSLYILQNADTLTDGVIALIKHAPLPLMTGVAVCAVFFSLVGFFGSRFFYDLAIKKIIKSYQARQKK
ncbi:MAG: DUF2062 domain-containing protein [Helicobacteraceae bacterium]|jgi:uncharacterized protein (DUF2062 family)|nr:DUF2062 domain-containing protein [Helicobacteraceae bacterium]